MAVESKNRPCSVYFISASAVTPMTKVGISLDPAKRLAGLKVASPYPLSLVASVAFGHRTQAEWAERVMHLALANYRMAGEWFAVGATDAFSLYEAIHRIIALGDFDPDDFIGICQMTAFQCIGAPIGEHRHYTGLGD